MSDKPKSRSVWLVVAAVAVVGGVLYAARPSTEPAAATAYSVPAGQPADASTQYLPPPSDQDVRDSSTAASDDQDSASEQGDSDAKDAADSDDDASGDHLSNDDHYVNSDGDDVHSPAYSTDGSVPEGATAQCSDGAYSFSEHHSGTCSGHGGVAEWLQ